MTDKEIRQYIKQILSKSHCPYQARRKIFTQIYGDIQQYLAGHPGCAREDVYHYFGSPDEAGHQYMTNLPPKALRKKLCLKKAAQTFLVCLCAVILLGGLYIIYVFYNTWKNPGYNVITTTIYETDVLPFGTIQKNFVLDNPRTLDDFPVYNIQPLKKNPAQ